MILDWNSIRNSYLKLSDREKKKKTHNLSVTIQKNPQYSPKKSKFDTNIMQWVIKVTKK